MKISDTYKRYLEVRGEIKTLIMAPEPDDPNERKAQLAKFNELYFEITALKTELTVYLKPFVDMARELGVESVSFERGRGIVLNQNKHYTVRIEDIEFAL